MSVLLVVSNPRDWPLEIPGVIVVPARSYLTEPAYGSTRSTRVVNLCKSYRYQSMGYYVSLLAEARRHKPLPRVGAIEDLQSKTTVRALTQDLDELIQRSLKDVRGTYHEFDICFGRHDGGCDQLAKELFARLQMPLLRLELRRDNGQWAIQGASSIAVSDIAQGRQKFMAQAAADYFSGRTQRTKKRNVPRFDIAILHDPDNPKVASNAKALQKFEKAAEALDMHAELITRADFGRLAEFDALFIRDTTFVNHYTYRFSRQALAEGLVVIDDPQSILTCNNKVYLAELLAQQHLPTPRTMLIHRGNTGEIAGELGLPCVLKQPDSSFSVGVVRVGTEAELQAKVAELLEKSELIIAQEYLPTEFDWRVGILDRQVLFVCKYYMARGHWQVIKHGNAPGKYREGPTEAVPIEQAPEKVVKLAQKAAGLIGDGFYGVDIKEVGKHCYVMEVNDNPNVDAGNEDGILKDEIYSRVMEVILQRIRARKLGQAAPPVGPSARPTPGRFGQHTQPRERRNTVARFPGKGVGGKGVS